MKKRLTDAVLCRTLLLFLAAACLPLAAADSTVYAARLGRGSLQLEVAATPDARERGLMFRHFLPPERGMLFIFPEDREVGFWMRNTWIPLSIAYLDSSFRIVRIRDLVPRDETTVPSGQPVRYALEVNRGWFARMGATVGSRLVPGPELARRLNRGAL